MVDQKGKKINNILIRKINIGFKEEEFIDDLERIGFVI